MKFDGVLDLARLPYFEADPEERELRIADASIGPVIDMHTHLALAYVLPIQVDLFAEHPSTEHYLPACCSVDFEVYINRNFTPEQLTKMKVDLVLKSATGAGMRKTHTVPNLTRAMASLRIERSTVLPIDFPVLSRNAHNALECAKRDERVIGFGSVHPYSRDVRSKLDEQVALGARGIKVHPSVQCVRPDDPRAMRLYRLCAERDLPVLWHCGPVGIEPRLGRYLSQVKWYERPIAENPRTRFVLGHAGALQPELALELVKRYPNVYLETSSQSLGVLRRMVEIVDPHRIVFGSDWPFYHQALPLAKVLLVTERDRALRHDILYGNAARLLKLGA
ncbi:MAG: amidohydrolase family protein [Labilithrix sp.]